MHLRPGLLISMVLGLGMGVGMAQASTQLFPLSDVRLEAGPLRDAQDTNLHYLIALDTDRLLAPFLREAGLPPKASSYGNWESSGLDGHMGGHYLSALALAFASTGDAEVLRRLNYVVAELKRAQEANGNGYVGGIPDGKSAWREVALGRIKPDSFSLNDRWVPWYNLHKVYAGLRDAYLVAGNQDARQMLIALSDWALQLTAPLSEAQMQDMLRSEHGGMNEIFADVAHITGDAKYLVLAKRFSHQALLEPLLKGEDRLTGLHANTQIPKVIGFQRISELSDAPELHRAAAFFWKTVRNERSVAIGGNAVREHFNPKDNFQPMLDEVDGPETCNTYNMLKLTEQLFLSTPEAIARADYADYYERALFNHILSSQQPRSGGLVYFTPMRPNHYRVYSQVHQGMWCCVGTGIESHAKYGEFIYAHSQDDKQGEALYVNLFVASTLNWRAKQVRIQQSTRFPDESTSRITVQDAGEFTLKIRYPAWVQAGQLRLKLNGKRVKVTTQPGDYVALPRRWAAGDRVDVELPMHTRLEKMPGKNEQHFAVLHGPIVLAAKTQPFANERLNFLADDSRMGQSAQGPICPQEDAPMFVSTERDTAKLVRLIKPVRGQPLTFTAPHLIHDKHARALPLQLIPFFRLHDSRYTMYWTLTTPADLPGLQSATARAEAAELALNASTIDRVMPGEQQSESDHFFRGDGAESGLNGNDRWRHAHAWFSYVLNDRELQAKTLRLSFSTFDAGRKFDVLINGELISSVSLDANAATAIYTHDFAIPASVLRASDGKLEVKFVAAPGSIAGGLYGLRLLR